MMEEGYWMESHILPPQVSTMANSLYHSLKGQYFVGYADNMFFEKDKSAWAMLYNPVHSGVNLFVNVWTVSNLYGDSVRSQIWFNSNPPGEPIRSEFVTPADTAIKPLPKPEILLLQASNVIGAVEGGVKGFARRIPSGETTVAEEDGKFVIPPGGNFTVLVAAEEKSTADHANVRVAYGWWEEPQCKYQPGKE